MAVARTKQYDVRESGRPQANGINDKGEEVPITGLMVEESMKGVKLNR
ncbi:hypothetical protein GP2143_03608 [marine gamma proteobacterium HTCC2143]|jgi:hypothetical protein|uniref:Uncharacterized protein n=1 Tax=marine gamma proteobacterium HTCC2143 TaxID=247633 RepID=A0YD73_9GAMM|nr:hypothetical protein GP2143_03608 [marine gamma proteobacterium HTCC2143]